MSEILELTPRSPGSTRRSRRVILVVNVAYLCVFALAIAWPSLILKHYPHSAISLFIKDLLQKYPAFLVTAGYALQAMFLTLLAAWIGRSVMLKFATINSTETTDRDKPAA
jgi:hypothetical protein